MPRAHGHPAELYHQQFEPLGSLRRSFERRKIKKLKDSIGVDTFNAVVTDAEKIAEYYRARYGKASTFIPYGAETGKTDSDAALHPLGLERGRYFLYVSRMEPENNALLVRQAFERIDSPYKLALIGDALHRWLVWKLHRGLPVIASAAIKPPPSSPKITSPLAVVRVPPQESAGPGWISSQATAPVRMSMAFKTLCGFGSGAVRSEPPRYDLPASHSPASLLV